MIIPNSSGHGEIGGWTPLREFNPYHRPGGSPIGGQFAPADGGHGGYPSEAARDAAEGHVMRAEPAAFKAALAKNSRASTLSDYSEEELRTMQLFLLKGGQAGYAIKGEGELVNLFNNAGKGAGPWLVVHAVEYGATHGDHFDGFLTAFYRKLGFIETKREANWTPGGPDVVYIKYAGVDKRVARARFRAAGTLNPPGI